MPSTEVFLGISIETWGYYFSILSSTLAILLCLSPIFPFIKIIRGIETYEIIPESMLIFGIIGRQGWSCYWFLQGSEFIVPLISSLFGFIISLVFSSIFLYYYAGKSLKKFFFYLFLSGNLVFELYLIYIYVFSGPKYLGKFLTFVTILIYFSPGQKVITVLKTGNYKLIPIWTSVIGLIASFGWSVFGIAKNDWNCLISNGIGFIFSVINTITWTYTYFKSKNKIKNKKNNEEIDEKKDIMLKDIENNN